MYCILSNFSAFTLDVSNRHRAIVVPLPQAKFIRVRHGSSTPFGTGLKKIISFFYELCIAHDSIRFFRLLQAKMYKTDLKFRLVLSILLLSVAYVSVFTLETKAVEIYLLFSRL